MTANKDGGEFLPELVVFDLDYTLWPFWADTHVSPPFTRKSNGSVQDRSGNKVNLYDDTSEILKHLSSKGMRLAAASRTEDPPTAQELLRILDIDQYFSYKEIYPGSKVTHFKRFTEASGIAYSNMLFFDDEERNIHQISRLGVTCVLVKRGMTYTVLQSGLAQFAANHK
ncbi:magnesium-dependent phosphatase 1-like isoform X1 [Stylophora pistillata]|uniref:Magnesium-dependent phosphatase 1 n=1 Tax=Stylophora pistillata TaxID=50429 RepID=A0A2B4RP88_STYPI|nr:magnesium-dependent phosphatase 1-like isoform X1 [Stylophora pistillata]PFX18609.1 Magnesium-dependent phosphatase 1 [Stylophora pistillata]